MKFLTDGMLGKLTRWLRLAGEDVLCVNDYDIPPEREDEFVLEKADEEQRVLLTRDLDLHREALRRDLKSVLIEEEGKVTRQMIEISKSVGKTFKIDMGSSRCPVCNGTLVDSEKSSVREDVPEKVLERNESFWKCSDCGKVYWPGSHWENIAEAVEKYERIKGDFSVNY